MSAQEPAWVTPAPDQAVELGMSGERQGNLQREPFRDEAEQGSGAPSRPRSLGGTRPGHGGLGLSSSTSCSPHPGPSTPSVHSLSAAGGRTRSPMGSRGRPERAVSGCRQAAQVGVPRARGPALGTSYCVAGRPVRVREARGRGGPRATPVTTQLLQGAPRAALGCEEWGWRKVGQGGEGRAGSAPSAKGPAASHTHRGR